MSKNITIQELGRVTSDGEYESLEFENGVNIIQGQSGTGKTVWLKMLDHLLGDRDNIEKALGEDNELIEKYVSIQGSFKIGDENITLSRNWNEPGKKGKILIDNETYLNTDEFSKWLFEKLEIPYLTFPKGNPYINTWPELSFRMMYRHIFRQERFWGDFADKQPESEQFAVLSQFLGFADKIFSISYDKVVEKNKELMRLEGRRDQFKEVLDGITRSMTSEDDQHRLSFANSEDIKHIISDLEEEISELLSQRKEIIENKFHEIEKEEKTKKNREVDLLEKRTELLAEMTELNETIGRFNERGDQFNSLRGKVHHEIEKLKRTSASNIISDLKVSHCPVCDQNVDSLDQANEENCYLCHRPVQESNINYVERLNFEIHQLESERDELDEIAIRTKNDLKKLFLKKDYINEQLGLIDRQLQPLRQKMSGFTDERLSSLDSSRGRIEEKIENYKRILKNIESKDELTTKIDGLNTEIGKYQSEMEDLSNQVRYEEISEALEDGMNSYLNQLNQNFQGTWPHGRIHVYLSEKRFNVKVGSSKWTTISALNQEYLLLAYHYGLLALSNKNDFNYPGLLICDFPPQFGEGEEASGNLNYLVQPFINLCQQNKEIQAIFSGKQLEGLNNEVFLNKLDHVWEVED
uniref:hypothetical protein n=1 Tax=Roseivirga sp. TaxID=1964215 RepID=UPI004047AD23